MSRFSSRPRPGECRAQINSLHSSGTAARTQRGFFAGAALAPHPAQPFSLPKPLFSVQSAGPPPPSFSQPLNATEGLFLETLISPPLPIFPTPYRPRPPGLQGGRRGAQGSSPRLRFGESLPPRTTPQIPPTTQQPGTAKRHPDGGMRVGWGAQMGQGQCFQRGRETGPRNIPLSQKFPFRGHGVCARRARGAGGGGVGVNRVAAGPPHHPRRGQ